MSREEFDKMVRDLNGPEEEKGGFTALASTPMRFFAGLAMKEGVDPEDVTMIKDKYDDKLHDLELKKEMLNLIIETRDEGDALRERRAADGKGRADLSAAAEAVVASLLTAEQRRTLSDALDAGIDLGALVQGKKEPKSDDTEE